MQIGRIEIFTDVEKINEQNIVAVLRDAMTYHRQNADRMDELIKYEAGYQNKTREKTYRSDIDNWCVDNIANEITEFKCGFVWGNPITLVQRGTADSGNEKEAEAIALLNECFEADNIKAKTQKIGYFTEITGICNEYIDINTDYQDGDSYFTTTVLDPRSSFVIKSSRYIDRRPMMGVTYITDKTGINHYTCVTKDLIFTLTEDVINAIEINPFGIINIIEWKRSVDRMGCFERQIDEMNNLNLLVSDFTNDVDQNTQCIFFGVDIEFSEDEDGNISKPSSGDWLLAKSNESGKPSLNPLSVPYDYNGMLSNIVTRRSLILQKCNVPQRNDNSGGSTGVAMADASGWSSAEMSACKEQPLQEESKMNEVKVALAVIKASLDVPDDSPLLKLRHCDIQPNIKRQKTYELTTKANAYATFVKHGVNQLDSLKLINAFDDPQQVCQDSKEEWKAFIDSTFSKSESNDRTMQDLSDQESNSNLIGGMKTGGDK